MGSFPSGSLLQFLAPNSCHGLLGLTVTGHERWHKTSTPQVASWSVFTPASESKLRHGLPWCLQREKAWVYLYGSFQSLGHLCTWRFTFASGLSLLFVARETPPCNIVPSPSFSPWSPSVFKTSSTWETLTHYFLTAAASFLYSIGPAHTELKLLIPGKYFSEGFALMMLVSSYSQYTSQPHPNNVNCRNTAKILGKWSCPLGSHSLLFSHLPETINNHDYKIIFQACTRAAHLST